MNSGGARGAGNCPQTLEYDEEATTRPTPRKPATNDNLELRSAPTKTIFQRPSAHPRPQTNNKEQTDERILKLAEPISSNLRQRDQNAENPIAQVDSCNRPRRRRILCKAGGKPSTWFPPGGPVEWLQANSSDAHRARKCTETTTWHKQKPNQCKHDRKTTKQTNQETNKKTKQHASPRTYKQTNATK